MRYYVYILLDDTEEGNYDNEFCTVKYKPFYVGKGDYFSKNKTKRHLTHYKETKKTTNNHKFNKIKKLQEQGFEPNFVIAYESDDEKKVLEVECKLINFYGKEKNGGILTNVTDGGVGGNLFNFVDGLREKLNKMNSERWSGSNNPNYKRKKEDTFSYKYKKENGFHWNNGRKMSPEHKNILKKIRHENLPIVEMICPNNYNIIDKGKTLDLIKKYDLKPCGFYNSLKNGGKYRGYYWKYQNKDLVLSKSKRDGYVKPKNKPRNKKIFFKKNISDLEEIFFKNSKEASEFTGYNKEVIRRKCNCNNTINNIFRYENKEYIFDIKNNKKKKIKSIDNNGNEKIYESVTEAAISIEGNASAIIAVCKGKRKKYRNLKFKYIKND